MNARKYMWAAYLSLACAPAWAAPEVGDKAPAINAAAWMNLPEGLKGLSAGDLKGRVVMVEFWATW